MIFGIREYRTLEAINQHGPLRPRDLVTTGVVPRGSVYKLIHRLEARGFVERSPEYAKSERYVITPKGQAEALETRGYLQGAYHVQRLE